MPSEAENLNIIVGIIKEIGTTGLALFMLVIMLRLYLAEREMSHKISNQHKADLRNIAKLPDIGDGSGD